MTRSPGCSTCAALLIVAKGVRLFLGWSQMRPGSGYHEIRFGEIDRLLHETNSWPLGSSTPVLFPALITDEFRRNWLNTLRNTDLYCTGQALAAPGTG